MAVVATQIHDLAAGPINLRDVIVGGVYVAIQNTGDTTIYFGELEVEPAVTDDGMKIEPGAILKISVDTVVEAPPLLGAWIWARASGTAATTRAALGL